MSENARRHARIWRCSAALRRRRAARYALYYTPAPGSALAAFGAAVLGAALHGLDAVETALLAALDPFRAAVSEAERVRRRPDRLDRRRRDLLERWGYPDVFEAFRFHITLMGPLAPGESAPWRARLRAAYGAGPDLVLDALTLLRQDGDGPFEEIGRFPFAGEASEAMPG